MNVIGMKAKSILFLILVFGIFGLARRPLAATIQAASCSQADLKAAIIAASNGDTVTLSGNCTWVAYHKGLPDEQFYAVIINKPITLQGIGNPVISHGDQRPAGAPDIVMVFIQPTDEHINDFVRVSGIYFENIVFCPSCNANLYTPDITVSGAKNFRLDHNTFHNGKDPLRTSGWSNGVIDSNLFDDTDLGVRPTDDADYYNRRPTTDAWGRPLKPGSADFVFIENNSFTTSSKAGCSTLNEYLYHSNGARAVSRYNNFTNYCTEYNMAGYDAVDAHGLPGCDRGSVLQEIYNNKFEFTGGPMVAWFNLRGGSFLIHDNVITTAGRPEQIRPEILP